MNPFGDLYAGGAERYARYRPDYPPALADALAGLAPRPGRAWDAGCGSGQLSVLLGDRFEDVLATDASAAQVARGRVHPRVAYRVASAEASGLDDASVDLAVSAQAAHWFDLPAYYREVRRVARPDGVLALVTYGTPRVEGPPGKLVEAFHRDSLGRWWPDERRHVEGGYRSLPFPFRELDVAVPDMAAAWDAERFAGYVATWSAVRAMEAAEGPDAAAAFYQALRAAWGPGARRVRWPLAVRAGRVREEWPG